MKLFKCACVGIIAILLCGCGESKAEFDAINVGKMNVVYENQTLKIAESTLDSAESQNLGANSKKNAESNIFCHSERSEESHKNNLVILSEAKYFNNQNRDSSVATLPQNDKNSARVAESALDSVDSQNLAKNQSREAQPKKALSGEGEGVVREGRGERLRNSSPLPLPQKKRALSDMGFDADLSARERKEKDLQNRDSSVAPLPQNDKIKEPQNDKIRAENDNFGEKVAESTLDSADSQNLQGGLPRRFCESARNDEFLKSLRDAEFADSTQKDFILFFFTSTCGVCKAQLPILEQLRAQDIKIYAILGDVPDISKASEFARAHKISLPLFYESGARRFFTSAVGGVKGVPVMVIFKDGKMKEKFIGLTPKGTLLRAI